MFACAKQFPMISVRQCRERCNFELQEMVLIWIQVDGVDSSWTFESIGHNVVAGACNGKDNIIFPEVEQTSVNASILPGESVDVFAFELCVLFEPIIIVDPPVMFLIGE